MAIDVAPLVALAEAQLLIRGEALAGDAPAYEAATRIGEEATVEIRLAPISIEVEAPGMQVNPSRARGRQLDAHRTPIRLDHVSHTSERTQCSGVVIGIDREIEVPMCARVPVHERVDTPAAPATHARRAG